MQIVPGLPWHAGMQYPFAKTAETDDMGKRIWIWISEKKVKTDLDLDLSAFSERIHVASM